ncbi:MAG: ribulose-phosphate 3-epimerase [Tissierellia bacterium]|nr:ribulose-phosphate 3-epimerase [Tissierellia bacterium]
MVKISPSILSADFTNIKKDFRMMEDGEADLIHVDVMDGHYVPNITFGPPVVKQYRNLTEIPFDVHLMIEKPEIYIEDFVKAGADILTIHSDATIHTHRVIQQIKSYGIQAGISINPGQGLEDIEYLLPYLDLVLLMSVNPGFGGQSFIPETLEKIKILKEMIRKKAPNVLIEVDGGVTLDNAPTIVEAGADILVAGTAIFKAKDPKSMIQKLKME